MNVNITGIYDNTVIVDSNLFDDVKLLQTGLSSLSDTLFNVVEGLPFQYANLTAFTTLSDDYEAYKITNNSNLQILSDDYEQFKINNTTNLSILNIDIDNLTTSLSILNTDISNNYVNNTTFSTLTTAVDDQFESTITYIDDKATEQHEYTDQEIEALRTEGYIQEAVTQLLAWATSDEGKRFRKKLWTRLQSKWASLTGRQPFTELLDDVTQSTSDELDDLLKVYRYDLNNAGIRTDPVIGKDIVMKGDTYIYDGNLYLTGNIHKGTYSSGNWTAQKILNDYFVMKGVKSLHCLDINNTTELLELHYDDLDFELGPAPYYYLKLKYPIHSVHPTQCLSIDSTTKQLEFNINTDYFDFESNTRRTLKPKFDANGVDDAGPLFIDFSTRKLRARYNDTLQVNASKELCTTFNCKGLKTGSVLSLDSVTKLLDFKYDINSFKLKINDELELKTGNSLSTSISGVDVKIADSSLSSSVLGIQISSTYKSELQQIKSDTENFKTQAQTAKTDAETAKTQAQTAKTGAETAKTGADTARIQAETAKTQAVASAGEASASAATAGAQAAAASASAAEATAAAAAAGGSAAAASGSAAAAGGSAAVAGAAAAAALAHSLAFIPGPQGPQGIPGEPSNFMFRFPLVKSYDQYLITPELYIDPSVYATTTSLSTFSTSTTLSINNLNSTSTTIFNKTNFSNLIVSGSSTLLSSLNVSGQSTLNNVNIRGNLNVNGTTTIIDTVVNNTTFNSFSVSGPSIYYSNVTLISSLNVSGPTRLNNTTLISTLNVSGTTTLNNTTIVSSLNVSGSTILNNATTFLSSLNVSGITILNSNVCIGTGITTLDSKLHIPTPDNVLVTTNLLNFKNTSDYGIYATSTSITARGNTLDFLSRDYNINGGLNITTRNILSLRPEGIVNVNGSLNVSGSTTLNNSSTCMSTLNVVGNIVTSGLSVFAINTYLNNVIGTSTTIFSNLNNLSTSTILSINNLNSTSTSLLNSINNYNTSIATLNLSTASLRTDLTSLSANLTLSINNLNATSTTIFNNLNSLSGQSYFLNTNLSSLNVSGTTKLNNATTLISSLNVSGITTLNNKTIIKGILNIHNGSPYATSNYTLNNGSLIIGDTLLNYGGGTLWNGGNAAGLMMECDSNTEIVVHDYGNRLASLMYYEGAANKITIGRDMGWGAINNIVLNGTVPNITLGLNGKINSYDDYHYIQISQPTDTLTIQEYGTISFNIGQTKAQKAYINSSGLNINDTLNVSGTTKLNNNTTLLSSLNVSGITTFSNNVGIGTTTTYSILHVKGTNPILTVMAQGNTGAESRINLATFDHATNEASCSLIATDTGSYGNTFKINLKTAGGAISSGQFTALFIDNTGNISCSSSLNVPGTTKLMNSTTCLSSLNVSGNTTIVSSLNVSGTTTLNGDKLNFPNTLNQYKINLWSTNEYGFGIAASTLQYSSQGNHCFYNSGNNANTFTIDSSGNITCTGYKTSGNNVWNRSADGVYRTYYATNEISYYCCGGNNAIGHIFYNNTYANVFQIKNNGDISCTGTISNGSSSYTYAGGLRLGGHDTGNTIWNGNNNLGLTVNSGYNVNIGLNGGKGAIMTINNTAAYVNNSSLIITPDTTSRNAITMYCYPNGISNSNGNSNSVNMRVACNTTGMATSDFLTVAVPDGWNGINTVVTLACSGGANSGYNNASRMILDGSYNTNASRGAYGSYIYWQSMGGSGWFTNMELYTSTGGVISTTLNVLGSVKSNGVTLTSSENIKSNIRDIYSPLDLINSFTGKHYHNKLTGEKDFGLIAEDIEKLCPCLTSRYQDSGVDIGVKYMNLTAVLIEAIKELNNKVLNLENILKIII